MIARLFKSLTGLGFLVLISCTQEPQASRREIATTVDQLRPVFDLPLKTDLGEHIVDGEQAAINKLFNLILGHMKSHYSGSTTQAYRAVHAKANGCVKATFEVSPAIDNRFKFGVFAKPQKYEAFIRFSNGDGPPENDSNLESRGMAVKVLNVEGAKILKEDDPYKAQDFLMADQPKFFLPDVVAYSRAIEAREGNILTKLIFATQFWKELKYRDSATPIFNPLNAQYWSKTPYQFGPTGVVKFTARPCVILPMKAPPKNQKNYMKNQMAAQVAQEETCFDFMLQSRLERADRDTVMPVEDASVQWNENISPFVKVAEIRIPKNQDLNSDYSVNFCENLSFNPWHSLVDERPLGSLNRVRKIVYDVSSTWRHEHNHTSDH